MKYKTKPAVVDAITFDELVEHGRNYPGANIVEGMPWSFEFKGHPITHEHDSCYLIPANGGPIPFTPNDILLIGEDDSICPVNREGFERMFEPTNDYDTVSPCPHCGIPYADHGPVCGALYAKGDSAFTYSDIPDRSQSPGVKKKVERARQKLSGK